LSRWIVGRGFIFGARKLGGVRVDPERVEVHRIDLDGLAGIISKLLELDSPRVIIEGRLWLLSTVRLGGRTRDIFLARGAGWHDGRFLADHARLANSPCPLILVPNLLPHDPFWVSGERILLSMSEFDWFSGDSHAVLRRITTVVSEHDRRTCLIEDTLFRKDGNVWMLSFGGKTVYVADKLGLGYIAELLRRPRIAIEAATLVGISVEATKLVQLAGIEMTDKATIKAVRADLSEKRIELASLQDGDWTRRGTLELEISEREKYLREVESQKGRARKVAGTAQRSRSSVTNAISLAIKHVSAEHSELGRHLKKNIKTGTAPVYAPIELPDWRF
jgi:hypothetical protein